MRLGSVNLEKRGKIALVILDEPEKLNALSIGMRRGILEALAMIDADDEIRAGIITGGSGKAFCAGADIGGFSFEPERTRTYIAEALSVLQAPERCIKPLIAAVNGLAYGGGFELAIACDFVIASGRAKFCVPEIQLGLLPAFAVVRLNDIVGRAKAKELSMLGEPLTAEEACRLGLVLKVVPADRLIDEALEFAGRIAAKPQLAVEMAKSFYNRGLGGDELRYVKDAFPFLFMHEDAREGIAAFREKRKPHFKD